MGLRKDLQLYKYQLDAVRWMKSVEDNSGLGIFIIILLFTYNLIIYLL